MIQNSGVDGAMRGLRGSRVTAGLFDEHRSLLVSTDMLLEDLGSGDWGSVMPSRSLWLTRIDAF